MSTPPVSRPLVLVLDSDGPRRAAIAERLEGRGYAVCTAASVAEALGAAALQPRALVLAHRLRDGTALDLVAHARDALPRPYVVVHGDWPVDALPPTSPGVDLHLSSAGATGGRDLPRRLARHLVDAVPLRPRCGMPSVRRGDHMMLVYEARPALLDCLAAYFSCGELEGERCILACDDARSADLARAHFERAGLDVERMERRGALALLERDESYFVGGRFDPQLMIEFIRDHVTAAVEDGYTGLRAAGEGSWLPTTPEDREAWFRYESELGALFQSAPLTAVCIYRREGLDPGALLFALRRHPFLILGGTVCDNPSFGEAPQPATTLPDVAVEERLQAARRLPRRLDEPPAVPVG